MRFRMAFSNSKNANETKALQLYTDLTFRTTKRNTQSILCGEVTHAIRDKSLTELHRLHA